MGFFQPPSMPFQEKPRLVTDEDLGAFKEQEGASLLALKDLQELDLSGCSRLTDTSITQVSVWFVSHQMFSWSVQLDACRPVYICPLCLNRNSAARTPDPQTSVLLALKHLHRDTLAFLLQVLRFPALQRLSLSMLPEISDESLVSVAQHCHCLTSLVLSHCAQLSDEGMGHALPHLHRLQHLHLAYCDSLTDRWVNTLINH